MQEIRAWKDNNGSVHGNRLDAAGADFVLAIERAWALLPTDSEKGDPKLIAKGLMTNIKACGDLADAIEEYHDTLRANAAPQEHAA